jgi:hypothetical protein
MALTNAFTKDYFLLTTEDGPFLETRQNNLLPNYCNKSKGKNVFVIKL